MVSIKLNTPEVSPIGRTYPQGLPVAPTHEIHNSERQSFRSCRLRHSWIFSERYYPRLTPKPLDFGTTYHKAMETYYDPDFWNKDNDFKTACAMGAFLEKTEQQKEQYLRGLTDYGRQPRLEADAQKDFDERVELGIGMLKYHLGEIAPRVDTGLRPIKVEAAFVVPVLDPILLEDADINIHDVDLGDDDSVSSMSLRCNSDVCIKSGRHVPNAPVTYAGRADCLMEQISTSRIFIFDWKTAAPQAYGRKSYQFLQTDDQIGSYSWAFWAMGLDIAGFIYHEQRKDFPKPPKRNTQPYRGCMYSVNKQQGTDYQTFYDTVVEGDYEAYQRGLYDEYLEHLRDIGSDHYWTRFEMHKTEAQFRNIGQNLALEAADMVNNPSIYPQAHMFACNSCAFAEPCIERTDAGDYQYLLDTLYDRRDHYWVREESSTDTRGGM